MLKVTELFSLALFVLFLCIFSFIIGIYLPAFKTDRKAVEKRNVVTENKYTKKNIEKPSEELNLTKKRT